MDMEKQSNTQKHLTDFAIGIAASVAASILITTGDWMFDMISNITFESLDWIEDTVYMRAAAVTPYSTTLLILSLVIAIALSVTICIVILTVRGEIRLSRSLAEIDEKYSKSKETIPLKENEHPIGKPVQATKSAQEKQREQLEARLNSLIEEAQRLERKEAALKRKHKLHLYAIASLTAFILVLVMVYTWLIVKPVRLRAQFEHEIYIVSPYVDEQTISQLKSSWVLMKTKADFIDIYNAVENIHAEYCIDGYTRERDQQTLIEIP